MKPNRTMLLVPMVVLVLIATQGAAAQVAPATTPPASVPAAAKAASLLEIVPADAWAVLAINDLQALDADVVQVSTKLGFPVPFAPSGLLKLASGVNQEVNLAGSVGAILLDINKFKNVRGWSFMNDLPVGVVVAAAAPDAASLLQSLNAQLLPESDISTVTLLGQSVFAAKKAGFVLFCPDLEVLKAVIGEPAAGGSARLLKSALSKPTLSACASADIYLLINIKPIATTYVPVLAALVSQQMAAAQAAQTQAAGKPLGAAFNQLALVPTYLNILAAQLNDFALTAELSDKGLNLSALLGFQPDGLFAKVFASAKPTEEPLLTGLPAGQVILAMGQQRFGQEYARQMVELFTQPMIKMLKESGNPELAALAEKQIRSIDLQVQMAELQGNTSWGLYRLGGSQEGLLAAAVVTASKDPAKLWEVLKQYVSEQMSLTVAQQPQLKPLLDAAVLTPDAETVGEVKVHNLLLDVTRMIEQADMSQPEAAMMVSVIKMLFGTDGLKIRIAVTDKNVVATLGGGTEFMAQVLATAKTGASPLSKVPAIANAAARLPKKRVAETYFAVDSLLRVIVDVAKQFAGSEPPFKVPTIDVALAASFSSDRNGLRSDLHVPIEVAMAVKDMILEAIARQMSQPTEPGQAQPTPMPAPEF